MELNKGVRDIARMGHVLIWKLVKIQFFVLANNMIAQFRQCCFTLLLDVNFITSSRNINKLCILLTSGSGTSEDTSSIIKIKLSTNIINQHLTVTRKYSSNV